MNKIKVLAIGTLNDKNHPFVTGQSVIFGMIYRLINNKANSYVINIGEFGHFKRGSFVFLVTRSLQYLLLCVKLIILCSTNRINVIYYQGAWSKMGISRDYLFFRIISIFKIPIINHQLGATKYSEIEKLGFRYTKKLSYISNQSTKIIVEGDWMKNQYLNLIDDSSKVAVVPNGLEEEDKSLKVAKILKAPINLLYLSNFIFSKGYLDVLKSVDILVNKYHKEVFCTFAGKYYLSHESIDNDPVYGTRNYFEQFIEEHGLQDRVIYYEGLYGQEKRDNFNKADFFLLPSYYSREGMPMSIIEAMSYGCVPIVTRHGHIPMLIDGSNGIFVNEKDPEAIAEEILNCIQNPSLYYQMSKNSISDFRNRFINGIFESKIWDIIYTNCL